MGTFKCDGCFHKKVCQESPAYGTVMDNCPSYIAVENCQSLQQLKAEIRSLIAKYDSYRMNDAEKCPGWILQELRELSAV